MFQAVSSQADFKHGEDDKHAISSQQIFDILMRSLITTIVGLMCRGVFDAEHELYLDALYVFDLHTCQ